MKSDRFIFRLFFLLAGLVLMLPVSSSGAAYPMAVTDASRHKLFFSQKPQRVVCLVPYITEMLTAFGQEQVLVGLTRQDLTLSSGLRKKNLGSYFSPDIEAVAACEPDLIIAAPSHAEVIRHFNNSDCKLMVMEVRKLENAFSHMEMIGRLFDCESRAAAVIRRNRDQLALVKARLAALPDRNRKRVVRVMAGDTLACPGDDSFQIEMITAAAAFRCCRANPGLPFPSPWNSGGNSTPRWFTDAT